MDWCDYNTPFSTVRRNLRAVLLTNAPEVDVGEWHAMDVKGKPELVSRELRAVTFHTPIPPSVIQTQAAIEPNLPWAEDQFQERVSGEPLNPGETYKYWPWQSKMADHTPGGVFSHTYMERYWPRYAGGNERGRGPEGLRGIRFRYGDLSDVVELLRRSPYTRQAVLPVWFPEDTGGVHGGRLPCSLTYHFLRRREADGKEYLHCEYSIRSCDFVRHFRDDVYMTMRLVQWVIDEACKREGISIQLAQGFADDNQWKNVKPGILTMHIGSLHVFNGDLPKLTKEVDDEYKAKSR